MDRSPWWVQAPPVAHAVRPGRARTTRHDAAERGFTLLELIVATAIFSILAALAVPSLADALDESRLENLERSLAATLRGARAEASVRRSALMVCARASDTACGNDWSLGWLVFIDDPGGTDRDLDAGEQVLRVQQPPGGNGIALTLEHRARWANGPLPADALQIIPRGRGGTSFFLLCDRRGTDRARAILVSPSGAVGGYTVNRNGVARQDPWNTAISCAT